DPPPLAAVTATGSTVGLTGLTLGGGYGPLIGRAGLALDNLLAAEVVLANGRVVVANDDDEEELFWALRGGGGNFGVVTAMRHRLHNVPNVLSGMLVYPFSEAGAVLGRCARLTAFLPGDPSGPLRVLARPGRPPLVPAVPPRGRPP